MVLAFNPEECVMTSECRGADHREAVLAEFQGYLSLSEEMVR